MKSTPGGGLLLLRRKAPLTRRSVAYFCSGAHRYSERRNSRVQVHSVDTVLATLLRERTKHRNHNIKIILTFSKRYRVKIDEYVAVNERPLFVDSLLRAVDQLWGDKRDRGPDICCVHPGFSHIQTISDGCALILNRSSQLRPVAEGVCFRDDATIRRERMAFERIFEDNSKGQDREIDVMIKRIKTLWPTRGVVRVRALSRSSD